MKSAWNNEITRTLGSALDQQRCFDFEKTVLRKIITREFGDARTRLENALHARTAQVDIAIFQSGFFVDLVSVMLVWKNGRRFCFIEDLDFLCNQFHFAAGKFGIRTTCANANCSANSDHIFASQSPSAVNQSCST